MSNEELAALADCVAILIEDIRRQRATAEDEPPDADNTTSRKDLDNGYQDRIDAR
jgi:hypothetical protein